MPLSKYFEGRGESVMRSMRKAHPGYSKKRVKAEFYATANKMKSKMPSHGAMKGPWGDCGVMRQEESVKAGGFSDGVTIHSSKEF